MPFVSRLWPSDDDDGCVTNIDFDVGDGGGDPKILMALLFSQKNEDQENRGLFWRLLLMKSSFHLLLLSFLLIFVLVDGEW